MIRCPSCNEENPPKFRLCGYCGASLGAPTAPVLPVREMRKTVTIVFSDLKDSTALGERIDAEALHEVKERYFGAMAAEIARHGGKVEKYIGDAIMAVFGLPKAHEDDALRAVRAAHGMRVALAKLNEGLRQRYGVALGNRTGVNTGEVVANDDPTADQKLATGDAVNVAARLEQAAPVDEIYLGETTWRLVRDAVEVETVEPLALKGKTERVAAYRLVSAAGLDGNVRRVDTPLAGRDKELAALAAAWQAVCAERTARLVTVIGDAGMGKSRLVHEIVQRYGTDATVLRGRCLPYGDGITFWPLVEMASALIRADDSPEQAQAHLLAVTGDADVAARLAAAIGLSTAPYPLHELNWAARRFLQKLAEERPLIAVIDDIHWAEPAFLDLIEHVLDAAADSPILLLATARHDLVEERPTWPDRASATRLVLEPLSAAAAETVITHLLGSASLPPTVVARIVKAAEGNPLYVEQMLSMLIDSRAVQHDDEAADLVGMAGMTDHDGDAIVVPPTIHALLEARLDRLGREERATVEPAAVVGVRFTQITVESLAPDVVRPSVPKHLAALHHKHFIEPTESSEPGAMFRFHHHLIRDTVYSGLLKRTRANLHLAYVRWADQINAERDRELEYEEILGYHLEQAHRYLGELGPLDEQGVAIGRDGARRLGAAGYRALERGDRRAAQNLYQRTLALIEENSPGRTRILLEYAESLMGLGRFAQARQVLDQCDAATAAVPDPRVQAHSQLMRLFIDLYSGEGGEWTKVTERKVQALIPTLEALEAHAELTMAWRLLMQAYGMTCKFSLATDAAERALRHARSAGGSRILSKIAGFLSSVAPLGAAPVPEAIAQCEQLLRSELSDRQVECGVMCALAQLKSMNCELEAARALYRKARAMRRELGQGVNAASTGLYLAEIELRGGDLAFAEREVRADYEFLEQSGESYFLSSMASLLAKLIRDQGRDEEALALTITAQRKSAADDVLSQAQWRSARAPILARAGQIDEAERLAKEGVELLRETEAPGFQADLYFELAQVLRMGAKPGEAKQFASQAIDLFRAKGDLYWARRVEEFTRQSIDA